jgi:hypothetical protein
MKRMRGGAKRHCYRTPDELLGEWVGEQLEAWAAEVCARARSDHSSDEVRC